MSDMLKRVSATIAIGGAGLLLLGVACSAAGARINTTKSIAIGLYWTMDKPAHKGAYVLFCPPESPEFLDAWKRGYIGAGTCPGGYGFLMKRVLAAKNDVVSIDATGVTVNGELLPLSTPIKADSAGRALPRYFADRYTLGNSEVLLMSDVSRTSFDGRYFGPIDLSQIKTVISPVITW